MAKFTNDKEKQEEHNFGINPIWYDIALDKFLQHLRKNSSLMSVDGLIKGITYMYQTSIECHDIKVLLRRGGWGDLPDFTTDMAKHRDAMININITKFGGEITHGCIFHHEKDRFVRDGWYREKKN